MPPAPARKRIRELGITPGALPIGNLNAITDIPGLRVGQVTLIEGEAIRTGVTAILPHDGNLYLERVPAGIAVGNGFGKLAGSTQVQELGEIETPIVLSNTLAVPRAAEALIEWTLSRKGCEEVRSVNPLVGETNDGLLNDIRRMAVTKEHVLAAITDAATGPVAEGNVGAGTGTVCFGWKGGIGTSSRIIESEAGKFIVAALVQSNFGGTFQVEGRIVHPGIEIGASRGDGSIMIVLATDAPLSDRNLIRLARRGLAGLARTGASMSDGSGDYVIAFSTAEEVRRTPSRRERVWAYPEVPNARMSPIFLAAIEAAQEAVYNSLCMAETMTGFLGRTVHALPYDRLTNRYGGDTGSGPTPAASKL